MPRKEIYVISAVGMSVNCTNFVSLFVSRTCWLKCKTH